MKVKGQGLLYEKLAQHITRQVSQGLYQPGDRVPSVRHMSARLKVSISTAVQAYRLLENQGVLEARPQSGYYVRKQLWQAPPEPAMSEPLALPTLVSIGELAMKLLKVSSRLDIMQLGVAAPHPSFLPTRELNRILTGILRRDASAAARYDYPPGCRALRVQIARRALESGLELTPEDIITTNGCQEALTLCLRSVAEPGDTIAIPSPTFYGNLQAIEALGMKALEIPSHPRDGISIDALRMALEQWPVKACLLIANFNNPLGSCMPEENKQRLMQLLEEYRLPLIEDDINGDLAFSPIRPKAVKAFDRQGLVYYCSSFSKTLAPGYRVGWVVPGRAHTQMEHLKYVNSMATPTLAQLTIAEFMASGGYERYLRKVRVLYARQVTQVTHAIARYFPDGTRVTQPSGGFVLWVELPENVDALELHGRALHKKISIAPGALFSAKQRYQNFIRISCANPWNLEMEKALMTIGKLATEMA